VRALEAAPAGRAYNVVDDDPVSWTRLMTELAAAVGAKPPRAIPGWLVAPMPLVRTLMRGGMISSNDRAKAELGWQPTVPTYRQGVARIARQHAGERAGSAVPSERPRS
jgi:nucleoside-diphosphate-sugar epimerase